MPKPKLVVKGPDGESLVCPVDKDVFSIGRASGNDLVLHDRWHARRHVEIRREGDSHSLHDLGCRCQKYVNGVAIVDAAQLRNGDVITLGDHQLTFLIEENEGKSEEALRAYSEAQQLKMQKKDAEAIAVLNRIVAIYPAADVVNESLMELGELEKERGNFEVAVGHFETLLAEHSESVYNALAQKHIAEIYETGLDDLQKAYEAYENVLINYPNSLYLEEVRLKLRELQGRRLNN